MYLVLLSSRLHISDVDVIRAPGIPFLQYVSGERRSTVALWRLPGQDYVVSVGLHWTEVPWREGLVWREKWNPEKRVRTGSLR